MCNFLDSVSLQQRFETADQWNSSVTSQSFVWQAKENTFARHAAVAVKSLQSCPALCDPVDGSPPGSPVRDSPGKNTGVGCHFLLQCMKVKSESEVAQLCPTPSNLMDCSLPRSSVHGIFQARELRVGQPKRC